MHGNKGKKQSKETIEKRAKALRGRKLSEEHKRKLSEAKIGCIPWNKNGGYYSEETRKRMSDAHKGHINSEEARKKVSKFMTGRKGELSSSWKGGIATGANLKEYQKNWNINHRAENRNKHLLKKFGITDNQYKEIFKKQLGLCMICKKKSTMTLAVDHDHKTGKIRGLLCVRCNQGLGHFYDNEELLINAIDYIRESSR